MPKAVEEIKLVLIKLQTVLSMMNRGEFIPAYEKLKGIYQRIDNIGMYLSKDTNKDACESSKQPNS